MAIISEIKCARCDRRYSGMRSRCPYCGARRNGRGKYSGESDNSTAKMLISILLMAVLVVAVIVLLVTSKDSQEPAPALESPSGSPGLSLPDEGDNISVPGTSPDDVTPPEESPPEESPPEETPPQVLSVTITYNGYGIPNKDMTLSVGESLQLRAKTVPDEADAEIVWKSSDESVFVILPTGKVTGLAKGWGTLTVTVGDVTDECIVRVR